MTNIIAHYGITVALSVLLHRSSNVAQVFAGAGIPLLTLKRFFGNPHEL